LFSGDADDVQEFRCRLAMLWGKSRNAIAIINWSVTVKLLVGIFGVNNMREIVELGELEETPFVVPR